jgi:hypothetical protein
MLGWWGEFRPSHELVKSQAFPTGVIVANDRPDGAVAQR